MSRTCSGLSETFGSSKFGGRGAVMSPKTPRYCGAGSGSRVDEIGVPASPWGLFGL